LETIESALPDNGPQWSSSMQECFMTSSRERRLGPAVIAEVWSGPRVPRRSMPRVEGLESRWLLDGAAGVVAQDAVVVFFHGYGGGGSSSQSGQGSSESSGDSSRPGGSSDSSRGGTSGPYPLYLWADKHFEYHQVKDAIQYLESMVGPPGRQTAPIVIGGHSWGGNSAITTAEKLIEKGYKVDMLFTLDPVEGVLGGGSRKDIPGVGDWWNFYQNKDYPNGLEVPDAELNEQATNADGQSLGHREVDDDPDIADRIRQHVEEIARRFKPSP
jgi:pimeloyl-ACP methyl ester carboxylesterase